MVSPDMIGFLAFGIFASGIGVVLYLSYAYAGESGKYVTSPSMGPSVRVDKRYFAIAAILVAVFCFDAATLDFFNPPHSPHVPVAMLGLAPVIVIVCRVVLVADALCLCIWVIAFVFSILSSSRGR